MKKPFRLVGRMVSHDTVEVLSELLRAAKKGEIIGLAIVAIHRQRVYEFALTGEAERSPTFALGAVAKLQATIATAVESNSYHR